MKKSVYSVVLSEDIVAEIDRIAYKNGTNRSGMINRILAEYISYETPEMKRRTTFNEISEILCSDERIKLISDIGNTIMNLRTQISYKYNPSVRYSVELYKSSNGESVGIIKATLRTQNATLIDDFANFCRDFDATEKIFEIAPRSEISYGKYSRLIVPTGINGNDGAENDAHLGYLIGNYLYMFDDCLKIFFASNCIRAKYLPQMRRIYSEYVKNNIEII